jgi:Ca-activated chloride channel homolog
MIAEPWFLLLLVPAIALLWWMQRTSNHPMPLRRRRVTLALRLVTIFLALMTLAGPAWHGSSRGRAVVFVVDHSQSLGADGGALALARMRAIAAPLPSDTTFAVISAGAEPVVRRMPMRGIGEVNADPTLSTTNGGDSDLAAALDLGRGLFPAGNTRQVVLITDGVQTRGDLLATARECALAGLPVNVAPVAGPARPDVRIARLVASRVRAHEGAAITLTAEIEASMVGHGRLRLFENGVEVAVRELNVTVGSVQRIEFQRIPAERNLYTYRVVAEGFTGDQVPANDEALALVDVAGRPRLLQVVGDEQEAHYLSEALTQEGIRLDRRPPAEMPATPQELAAYDGIILSDVPARLLSEAAMDALKAYVEEFGGGLVVAGGTNSYGVGGYFRTPLEELLPVKMQSQDTEEKASVALALVIDRSGSMSGEKLEVCKSAAIATAQLLQGKDYLGVVVFDSSAEWTVPMARLASKADVQNRIASIAVGGGTNIWPGMSEARAALARTPAKTKHMIVLTDGQSQGSGYPQLASSCKAERITVSTVAVGGDADAGLLQSIATAGGGKFYLSQDPRQVPRIFTQDAMTHLGKLVREQAFAPRQAERHPMIAGWDVTQAPNLLGYVRTLRRATAQVPLVTDLGDPLLAHWRFGTGKVTAFTSDCTSRWSGLWLARWPTGFSQLWVQMVRETIRQPQGRRLDLRLEEHGSITHIEADLREDADTWKDGAQVQADVFHVPTRGGELRPVIGVSLQQDGPGRYRGTFRPSERGVYLVRARSGGDTVSAGLVHNPGSEVATGTIDRALLNEVARLTGGAVLEPDNHTLPEPPPPADAWVDLRPALLALMLLVFLIELSVRRWENVLGVWERVRERGRSKV